MTCRCCKATLKNHKHFLNEKVAICDCCFHALLNLKKNKPGIADQVIMLLEDDKNIPLGLFDGDECDKND